MYKPINKKETDELWDKISTEMDIDEVWSNISSGLDEVMPADSGSGIIVKSIIAILIILTGMIPARKAMLDSGINQAVNSLETKQNEQVPELITENEIADPNAGIKMQGNASPALRSSSDKSKIIIRPTPGTMIKTNISWETPVTESTIIVSNTLAVSKIAYSDPEISHEIIPFGKPDISPALIPDYLKNIKVVSKTDFDSLKIKSKMSGTGSSFLLNGGGRISGGVVTQFKNTWLLNYETFDGLKSESLTTTLIKFFPDVGLSLNYSLNNTWLLQADGFFYSNTGQEYYEYISGHYTRKVITLRYSTVDISVKHKLKFSSYFIPRSSINALAGCYLSVLQSANQKLNTDLENIKSQYRKFDLGVRLGGEFELHVFDQLSIAPGLFLSVGIPNIYNGDKNIPISLSRTHNGSAEFQVAFYYHFD